MNQGLSEIEEKLISRIDITKDDYLYSIKEDAKEKLLIDSLVFGRFTNPYEKQMLAIFKVTDAPHAAGLDRTIAAIYIMDTSELITQKTFVADNVLIRIYEDSKDKAFILYIGEVTYQGNTVYSMELYDTSEGEWATCEAFPEELSGNLAFALTGDSIHVMELSYSEYIPVYEHKFVLTWDYISAGFIRTDVDS